MLPTRSTCSSVASPRNDWISCTSHWNSSVVSAVSGRIQADPRSRTAPMRWSLRHTPTRCRVGVGGRLIKSVSHRMASPTVTLDTWHVKRYTPRNLPRRVTDGKGEDDAVRAHPRARPLLSAAPPPPPPRPPPPPPPPGGGRGGGREGGASAPG